MPDNLPNLSTITNLGADATCKDGYDVWNPGHHLDCVGVLELA